VEVPVPALAAAGVTLVDADALPVPTELVAATEQL
jgi:hypothetical protein